MDEHTDNLTLARQAYAARDWRTAAACFAAVPTDRLTADDLAAHADAAWWLGRIEDNLRLRVFEVQLTRGHTYTLRAAGTWDIGTGADPGTVLNSVYLYTPDTARCARPGAVHPPRSRARAHRWVRQPEPPNHQPTAAPTRAGRRRGIAATRRGCAGPRGAAQRGRGAPPPRSLTRPLVAGATDHAPGGVLTGCVTHITF